MGQAAEEHMSKFGKRLIAGAKEGRAIVRESMKNPAHPGALVQANLDELGLSVAAAAEALGVTPRQLVDVLAGNSGVTPDMAVGLAKTFGGTAALWLRMQAAYDLARKE